MRESRLPDQSYVRNNLGKKNYTENIKRQRTKDFNCGKRVADEEKCGPHDANTLWEYPCYDVVNGFCYDEDWSDENGVIVEGANSVTSNQ